MQPTKQWFLHQSRKFLIPHLLPFINDRMSIVILNHTANGWCCSFCNLYKIIKLKFSSNSFLFIEKQGIDKKKRIGCTYFKRTAYVGKLRLKTLIVSNSGSKWAFAKISVPKIISRQFSIWWKLKFYDFIKICGCGSHLKRVPLIVKLRVLPQLLVNSSEV